MVASELLNHSLPTLLPGENLERAEEIFSDHCICHIPIVSEENMLEGILPLDILMGAPNHQDEVSKYKEDWIHTFAFREQHGLSVFETIAKHELSAIPVVDEERRYLGSVITSELLARMASAYSFKEIGGIIVLSLGMRDYDLNEVARIVESNNAKILVLYMDTDEENDQIKLTLKINSLNLRHILATFDRYKYTVDFHFPADNQTDELRERYDLMLKLFDL